MDGERVVRTAGGVTTVFFEGLWEQTTTGVCKLYYTFNGQVVAMRDSTTNTVTYLHGDHLVSVSVATDSNGTGYSTQEFDPWGAVRAGGIGATGLNYTGQRLDATGLLYYHARYYNPLLARFVSGDSVVPGNASGSMAGVALKGLTVDFHEPGFVSKLGEEDGFGLWFQLSDDDKQQLGSPWGPANPQALNRYSYVLNGPMRWTDPSGHVVDDSRSAYGVGYEVVKGTPNSTYVDSNGHTVYTDSDGNMYKINADGERERLYRVYADGSAPGCSRAHRCYKYVYERESGFSDFKAAVNAAADAGIVEVGAGSLAGAIGGCAGAAAPSGGIGCPAGAVIGGLAGAIAGAGVAGYKIITNLRSARAYYDDFPDLGMPQPMMGPPKPKG